MPSSLCQMNVRPIRDRAGWLLPFVLVSAWIAAQLQSGHALTWDELEFFRATRWVGDGLVPFRDFWEHHTPLQWLLFAPMARLLATGPGTAAVVTMRWAQVPLWLGIMTLLRAMMNQCEASCETRRIALLLLLTSRVFVLYALEYRVDTLGNLCYLAALILAFRNVSRPRAWIGVGVLLSSAVLSNVRMAPLVVVTGALLLIVRPDERRWRFNPSAMAMAAGLAIVLSIGAVCVVATGARPALADGLLRYNMVSDRLMAVDRHSLATTLLLPFRWRDVSTLTLVAASIAGLAWSLRELRRPNYRTVVALLAAGAFVLALRLGVHYPYHFQTALLMIVPLAAMVLPVVRLPAIAIVIGALTLNVSVLLAAPFGAAMRYQDAVMQEVQRRTSPRESVWDGSGYALSRRPAYRYWFLPAGVRLMAQKHLVERYGARELLAAPPAAIVVNDRLLAWIGAFPDLAPVLGQNYLPLYRNLWIPGMSGVLAGEHSAKEWMVLRGGRYRIWPSELLARHLWFRDPVRYATYAGPHAAELEATLALLPPVAMGALQWSVNGRTIASPILDLRPGDRLRAASAVSSPVGIVVVPVDVKTIFVAPLTVEPF